MTGGVIVDNSFGWDDWFDLAQNYYNEYGDLEVPARFKTYDGITYDENGYNLGMWIAKQRERCNPDSERGKKLSEIGMRFFVKRRILSTWEEMFELAKAYYNKNGDLNIPYNFKTNDGITYDENGLSLGVWVYGQKLHCNVLSDRGRLLSSIGMKFQEIKPSMGKKMEWYKFYFCAVEYYNKNGNLDIPRSYKTESGLDLGMWIVRQRTYYGMNKLSPDRISKLESIGMIWEKRNNSYNVLKLCAEIGLDTKKNSVVLKHISLIVLESKMSYLRDNMIRLVDENGLLHEIFSMSNFNMKLKYGVGLEDLVEIYKEKSK